MMRPAWQRPFSDPADNPGTTPDVVPLTDARCADPDLTGPDVALLSQSRNRFLVPPTVIAVGAVTDWRSPDWARLHWQLGGTATIRGWVLPSTAGAQPLDPLWYNIGVIAVEESVAELVGLARRTAGGDESVRLVVSLQRFLPAQVSVTVTVAGPGEPARVRSRWGLDDDLGGMEERNLLVMRPDLTVVEHRIVHQPAASGPAAGGTQLVEVAPRLRGKPGLSVEQARPIVRRCGEVVRRLGRGVTFEMAIHEDDPYLLNCRPT
jgi:hypothetical protein